MSKADVTGQPPYGRNSAGSDVTFGPSSLHGRGLFAARAFAAEELIGEYPLLILSIEDVQQIRGTRIHDYLFFVDEDEDEQMRAGVAFGPISLCNHDDDANARFEVQIAAETVRLIAVRPIGEGEEIFIDYVDFAEIALARS